MLLKLTTVCLQFRSEGGKIMPKRAAFVSRNVGFSPEQRAGCICCYTCTNRCQHCLSCKSVKLITENVVIQALLLLIKYTESVVRWRGHIEATATHVTSRKERAHWLRFKKYSFLISSDLCTQGANTHRLLTLYRRQSKTDLHVQTYCLLRNTESIICLHFDSSVPVKC
jgi:hypothetical protein